MSEFSEDPPYDWVDLLRLCPLFECLNEEGTELVKNGNLLCESRGDLFVWSSAKSAVLTTNLKRLKAHPSEDQPFQMLVCTAAPLTAVTHLVPDELGGHIALLSRQAVSVMTLPRSRGEHGEFGGGKFSVNCRVTPMATDLFTIHHHTLHLLQAHWHLSLPHTLLLLTSDSTLHVFSMADPNYARHTIPLTPSAATQVHSCTLEDTIVSFACTRGNTVFALRDTGDIMVTQLAPPPRAAPSEPLPMHPMSEDNYGTDEATALLMLETTPPVLIIAHSSDSGTIYHCVYMEGEKEGEQEEGEELSKAPASSASLYVVECVKLELQEDDESLFLTRDPVLPYRYFIRHREGMHMVTIPWANRMNQFTTSSMEELVMKADSDVSSLLLIGDPTVSSIQGVAIISEPLLGPTAVLLTSDLQCQVFSLRAPPPAQFVTDVGATPTRPHPQVRSDTGGFVKVIQDILDELPTDPVQLHAEKKDWTQQECFHFLQHTVQCLRAKYLLPQQKAKAALQRRLDILARQKEQQLRDLVAVRDMKTELMEKGEDLRCRVEEMQQRSSLMLLRMEQLLCKLDAQSPVLSNAEVLMKQELNQLSGKLHTMECHIEEAKGKLKLGYGEVDREERVSINKQRDDSICSILDDAGKRLLALKLQIKSIGGAMPT